LSGVVARHGLLGRDAGKAKGIMIHIRFHDSRTWLVAAAIGAVTLTGCSGSSSGGAGGAGDSATAKAEHSETFHNVSPAVNKRVQKSLPLMRGVASATYQNGDLVVTFKSSAEKLDQRNVENIVKLNRNAATAKPSPTAKGHKKK